MLQVARLAPNLLHDAADRVLGFLHAQLNGDGGFSDRVGSSDLYYTVFGLESLLALRDEPPVDRIREFLEGFGDGEGLDFVHLTCLARSWASLPGAYLAKEKATRLIDRIEAHRAADGGYHARRGSNTGAVYHAFLALGAYQDLGAEPPDSVALVASLDGLRCADGAFGNDRAVRTGTTTVTAAAVSLMRHFHCSIPSELGDWLLAQGHPDGGFRASPQTPMPDLLSTAAALHALAGMHVSFAPMKEKCLDFIDSLWTGTSFCGHWADDVLDCEYTYYALLALGHLSL